jgi:apolipoprotein N-acyltransferase
VRAGLQVPLRLAGAALSGVVLLAAFPPYDLPWLAPIAVTILTLAIRGCGFWGGGALGLVSGLAFFVPLLHWSGIYVGATPWLIFAGSQAVYIAVLGAATALVTRVRWWPLWVAALWVGEEAVRTRWPFGGFPWGRLAFSQADLPTVWLATVGGAPLVTFAVALVGALLASAVVALARPGPGIGRASLAVLAAAAVAFAGAFVPVLTDTSGTATVAIVQGNVPRLGLDFNAQRQAVLDNHVNQTIELAQRVTSGELPRPDFVVWPENASDIDPLQDDEASTRITDAAQAIGVPILVGTVLREPEPYISNVGLVWDPVTGPGQQYVKRHPVPFAEYIPLRSLARRVSSEVDRVSRDMVAGTSIGVLDLADVPVGVVICFEVGYDGLVRDTVLAGGQILTVQTNNATFGRSPESAQQLEMSRVRAIEHGRTVLVAATSGISAIVAPDGTVLDRSEIFTPDLLVAEVALRNSVTAADRVGTRAETGLAVLGLAAVIAALITGWRSRRRGDRPSPGTSDSDAAERLRDVFAPTGSSGPVGKADER